MADYIKLLTDLLIVVVKMSNIRFYSVFILILLAIIFWQSPELIRAIQGR